MFFKYSVKKGINYLKGLKKKKIGVSIHYATPLPSMSYYKNKYNLSMLNYQKAKVYANTNISLPVYPSLKSKEQNKVINVIKEFYGYSK